MAVPSRLIAAGDNPSRVGRRPASQEKRQVRRGGKPCASDIGTHLFPRLETGDRERPIYKEFSMPEEVSGFTTYVSGDRSLMSRGMGHIRLRG